MTADLSPQPAQSSEALDDWHIDFAETSDIDEQAQRLRGWNQIYAQTEAGAFEGSISQVSFSGLHLFSERTSRPLFQVGALNAGEIAVGVPLEWPGRGVFCGAPCSTGKLHVFSGEDGFAFQSPAGLVMGGLVLERRSLMAFAGPAEQEFLARTLTKAHLRPVGEVQAAAARDLLSNVLNLFQASPCLARSAQVRAALSAALLSNVAEMLIGDGAEARLDLTLRKSWDLVSAAHDHVLANPDRPVSIGELCGSLGVSRRTLHNSFHDALGESPASFLRAVRINGVRRALRTAPSVTEAATSWGFWHFGRFASDYKSMFGELPSDTHRRLHGVRPKI